MVDMIPISTAETISRLILIMWAILIEESKVKVLTIYQVIRNLAIPARAPRLYQ